VSGLAPSMSCNRVTSPGPSNDLISWRGGRGGVVYDSIPHLKYLLWLNAHHGHVPVAKFCWSADTAGHYKLDYWRSKRLYTRMRRRSDVMIPVYEHDIREMRHPKWVRAAYDGTLSRRWCGECRRDDVMQCHSDCKQGWLLSNMIDETYENPGWCGMCDSRVLPLCDAACYGQRLISAFYQRLYANLVVSGCPETLCTWCSRGAGDWCETCDRTEGPASAICRRCESTLMVCRICRAESYVEGRGSPRRPRDASRRYRRHPRDGRGVVETCAVCYTDGIMQKCAGCRTVHYCGVVCERADWRIHKPICRMLQGPISVNFIYPWHRARVRRIRAAASILGAEAMVRFESCFSDELYGDVVYVYQHRL